jgi:hypothetical protein
MIPFVWLAVATLIGVYTFNYYRCFARNLAAAKQSGLPYVVAPVYGFNRFWLVTHKLWIPLLEKLPKSWTDPWLQYVPHLRWHYSCGTPGNPTQDRKADRYSGSWILNGPG